MLVSHQIRREVMLLYIVTTSKETSFSILSEQLDIPKRRISADISKLNRISDQIFDFDMKLILTNKAGIVKINPPLQDESIEYYYRLKFALLNESSLYQLCIVLVINGQVHKNEIIDRLFISTHYLIKLCQQLNTYLSTFNLSVKKKNSIYSIEGDEISYRLFTYLLLQDSFQGINWPFELNIPSVPHNKRENDNSLTKNFSIQLFSQLLSQRFKFEKFLPLPFTDKNYKLFEMIMENFDSSLFLENGTFDLLESSVEKSERLYLNFFQRVFLSDLIPMEKKIELGNKFKSFDHDVCSKANQTYERFSKISLALEHSDTSYIYLYYLTIFLILYQMIGNKYFHFLNLLTPTPYLNINKKDNYTKTIKSELDDLYEDKDELNYIANLLYTLSYFRKKSKIRIYIQMTKIFTSIYAIQERLHMIFNPDHLIFTNNYSEADIVITDSFERKRENQTLFYLDTINNKHRWSDLIKTIQQKLIDKLDSEVVASETQIKEILQ